MLPVGFGGYLLIMVVGMLISGAAALWVRSSYSKFSKQRSASGLTGAQTARMILDRNGLSNVKVEPVAGQLTDHYDPRSKVVRLSEDNYTKNSIAGVSVAAHEVGHAIQDASGYVPMKLQGRHLPGRQHQQPVLADGVHLRLLRRGRGDAIGVAPDQPRRHHVHRGSGLPPRDAAGGDQRLHPRLRAPDAIRDPVELGGLAARGGS